MARSCAERMPASCDPPQAHAHSGTRAVQKGHEYLFSLKLGSWWVSALTFVEAAPWPLLGHDVVSAPRHCKSEGKTLVHRAPLPQAGVQRAEGRTWLRRRWHRLGPGHWWWVTVAKCQAVGVGNAARGILATSECGVLT